MSARARRLTLLAFAVTALTGASSAWAASGTVLSVNAHTLEVIRGEHVHGYRYSRAALLPVGSQIHFSTSGGRMRGVAVEGRPARRLAFTAAVVSYGAPGLVLRLADGGLVKFSARRVRRACTSSAPQLRVGEKLRVAELLAGGAYRLVMHAAGGRAACTSTGAGGPVGGGFGGPPSVTIQHAAGVLTAINPGDVTVHEANGPNLTLSAPADALDFLTTNGTISLTTCETVAVSYHQASAGLELDSLAVTGQASLGCVEGDGVSLLVVGTLASVGGASFTVNVPALGVLTLAQDPSNPATDGLSAGDQVLVAYTVGSGGTLAAAAAAQDVMYTTGTVMALLADGAQLTDWTTASTRLFLPDSAGFQNARTGDAVGVAYYAGAAGLETENVDDLTNGTTG
jgi:hypothetical protein